MSPDGSKNPPPEEKLLKLIRGTPKLATPGAASASPKAAPLAGGRLSGLWRLPAWWLKAMNIGLGCLILGEVIALVIVTTRQAPTALSLLPSSLPPAGTSPPLAIHDQESADAGPLLAASASRPLFHSGQSRTAATQVAPPTSSEAKALASRLSLIGIVPGDPAQAIVEDTQTKKTYFVNVGQHVVEGLVVQDIREDRIILNLNGEYIELSL